MQGNNELCVPVVPITVWDYSIISPQNHMRKKSHAQCTAFCRFQIHLTIPGA